MTTGSLQFKMPVGTTAQIWTLGSQKLSSRERTSPTNDSFNKCKLIKTDRTQGQSSAPSCQQGKLAIKVPASTHSLGARRLLIIQASHPGRIYRKWQQLGPSQRPLRTIVTRNCRSDLRLVMGAHRNLARWVGSAVWPLP